MREVMSSVPGIVIHRFVHTHLTQHAVQEDSSAQRPSSYARTDGLSSVTASFMRTYALR